MALRDQPYLPLYVQDFLTDEKLAECSAAATGVYIRLLCILHKQENYGCILLKQKHKQNESNIDNFSSLIVKQMPYDFHTVKKSLVELIDEKVLLVEGDMLIQKRMVKDNEISEKRSSAGKKGGEKTTKKNFAQANAQAKTQANSEYENENEIGIEEKDIGGMGEKEKTVHLQSNILFLPSANDLEKQLPTNEIQNCKVVVSSRTNPRHFPTDEEINQQWNVFKAIKFNGQNSFYGWNKVFESFKNYLGYQISNNKLFSNGSNKQILTGGSNGGGTSSERVDALKNW